MAHYVFEFGWCHCIRFWLLPRKKIVIMLVESLIVPNCSLQTVPPLLRIHKQHITADQFLMSRLWQHQFQEKRHSLKKGLLRTWEERSLVMKTRHPANRKEGPSQKWSVLMVNSDNLSKKDAVLQSQTETFQSQARNSLNEWRFWYINIYRFVLGAGNQGCLKLLS